MKNKLTLIVVLVAVAGAYILLTDPAGWFKPSAAELALADPGKIILCGLSQADITAFTITKPSGEQFRLERQGDNWRTVKGDKSYKAQANKIERLLSDIPGVATDTLLTDKASKHASFEVDAASGIRLGIEGTGLTTPIELTIGKAAPGYKGSFVRVGNGNEVYTSTKNLKSLVGFSFNDYRSKKPWEFDTLGVESLAIRALAGADEEQSPAVSFNLNEGMWEQPEGGPGNQNKLAELVDKLSKMSVSTFADDATAEETKLAGLEPHLLVSTASGNFSITVGALAEGKYYIADGAGVVYQVSEYSLKFLLEQDIAELSFDDSEAEDEAASEFSLTD